MFYTEKFIIDGFDEYDENLKPIGCYSDQLKLVITCGKRLITYELEFCDHRKTITHKFKDLRSTDELDLILQEVMEKMFGDSRFYGPVYYDVDLIAA